MSSAVSSSQVTSNTPILVTTPSTDSKPYSEHKRDDSSDDQRQQLSKQTKTYTRGNSNKNKQLTRSHAMKESASPPRTPNSHSPNDMKSHSPTAPALNSDTDSGANNSLSPSAAAAASSAGTASSQLLTAPTFILPQPESNSAGGKSQLDIEFPKLTPPKTKVGWSSSQSSGGGSGGSQQRNRKSVSSDTSSNNNSLCEDTNESHVNDNKQQQQKTGSQTISVTSASTQQQSAPNVNAHSNEECEKGGTMQESYNHDERVIISPSRAQCKSPNLSSSHNNNINLNNSNSGSHNNSNNSVNNSNTNAGTKSAGAPSYPMNIKNKPPLKNMGSSSSCEGGNTSSGFISRDSSSEQFVDQNGIDLVQFFKETLNKNAKDRNMLMKIERELLQLAVDQTGRTFVKFPSMSSYNRMLVHRTAAYFGMDHNVDATQQCVIASTTKETRIPDIRFKTLIRDTFSEEPRKSILKRETHSFEDYRQGGLLSVQRSILNRKAKSFEERDEEYEKEWQWIHHSSSGVSEISNKVKVPIRLMKIHSSSMDGRYVDKAPVSKSHSFGGYGGPNVTLMRDDSISSSKSAGPRLHKQDSTTSTTWRLSPSSSGYKTQSLRSDSVTPSPTGGYGSDTLEPSNAQSPESTRGVVWAVTDLASVPKGSLIIDPQTLQPILNQDGSLYHFDPSNPPTTAASASRYGSARKKADRPKSLNNNINHNNNNNNNNSNINNNNMSSNNKPNSSKDHTNNGCVDNEKSSVMLGSATNKHVVSKFNNQMSHNHINNDIDDDEDEDEEDEDDIDDETDQTDLLPLDTTQPKTCESLNEDECKTKDEKCENKSSQCELKSQSSHLNAEELMSPKQKNQSTSPNLPLNETINEEEESVTPTSSIQPIIEEEDASVDSKKDEITSATETPPVQEIRFQQSNPYTNSATASATPTMPPTVLGYAPTTPFTTPIETAGTIYHTGPDGTLYVLSQPVMYSYTTSTENEVPSCWVPIFDQGARGDPNLTVLPVATPYNNGPTIYQSPVVYSTEQFTNSPAIAGQVTQYPVSAYPAMGYATYPVNGAPYQNIWPQPMTYFLPPSATPGPTQVLVPPAAPQTPNATIIQSASSNSHNTSTNANVGGRRSSPPNNSSSTNNSNVSTHGVPNSVGPNGAGGGGGGGTGHVPLQTFPSSVPFSLATSESTSASGPTALYAIPPSMYPANMLPAYPAPTTGFYQPLPPHPQTNTTIISSVIPHSHAGTVPSTPHSFQATNASGEIVTHFPFNQQPPNTGGNNNAASTPQSAPSTPLSLTTVPPNFKNQPIFAAQPLIAAAPVHIAHTYENDKKNNNNGNGSVPKKYHNNSGNGILSTPPTFSHATKNPRHQQQQQQPLGGYQSSTPSSGAVQSGANKKSASMNSNCNNLINNSSNSHSEDTNSLSNSNMSSSNYSSSNRVKNSSNRDQNQSSTANSGGNSGSYQPKISYKQQQSYSSNSNSPNSNDNSESTNSAGGGGSGKFQPRGPSRIPPLDLKRNNSGGNVVNHHTRSTPSTNSTESNNSPNSITSYDHSRSNNYHYTAHHQPHQSSHQLSQSNHNSSHHQHHPPQQQQSYQQSSGAGSGGAHFYRGGSVGAVSTNMHHNMSSGNSNTESPSIQTCFPFVHSQNPGTSTPLLDSCHPQTLIGYNNPMATGMYVKFGQAFTFANPLPNNRKSPSNDIRAPLAPLAGVYSTMMLPGGPRPINPRTVQNNHHHYKGNRTQQR